MYVPNFNPKKEYVPDLACSAVVYLVVSRLQNNSLLFSDFLSEHPALLSPNVLNLACCLNMPASEGGILV